MCLYGYKKTISIKDFINFKKQLQSLKKPLCVTDDCHYDVINTWHHSCFIKVHPLAIMRSSGIVRWDRRNLKCVTRCNIARFHCFYCFLLKNNFVASQVFDDNTQFFAKIFLIVFFSKLIICFRLSFTCPWGTIKFYDISYQNGNI